MVKPAKHLSPLDVYSTSTSPSPPRPPPPALRPVTAARFKGVRMRSWGRWVSEIRVPHSRDKIWLGSYSTAEQAARAYDVATILLRGAAGVSFFNFPDSEALIPSLSSKSGSSPRTVQTTAARIANLCADDSVSIAPPAPAQPQLPPSPAAAPPPATPLTPGARWFQELLCMISPKESNNSSNFNYSNNMIYSNSVNVHSNMMAGVPARTASGGSQLQNQLQFCCDDIFHTFEMDDLAQDGFTAMSAAVTTCERFDKDIGRFELDGNLWDVSDESSSRSV